MCGDRRASGGRTRAVASSGRCARCTPPTPPPRTPRRRAGARARAAARVLHVHHHKHAHAFSRAPMTNETSVAPATAAPTPADAPLVDRLAATRRARRSHLPRTQGRLGAALRPRRLGQPHLPRAPPRLRGHLAAAAAGAARVRRLDAARGDRHRLGRRVRRDRHLPVRILSAHDGALAAPRLPPQPRGAPPLRGARALRADDRKGARGQHRRDRAL